MANSKQAKKRALQSAARNKHLSAQRSRYRTAIKSVRKAIATGDKEHAQEVFHQAQSVIDKLADKGVFHKNSAARHKSNLSAAVKAMPTTSTPAAAS
ncbi:MAG: 30S ribosomal protein S20 [Burkholderiales bacterium]|nr:30S ribosomal protein S20 [Burkholderiales bacterium]